MGIEARPLVHPDKIVTEVLPKRSAGGNPNDEVSQPGPSYVRNNVAKETSSKGEKKLGLTGQNFGSMSARNINPIGSLTLDEKEAGVATFQPPTPKKAPPKSAKYAPPPPQPQSEAPPRPNIVASTKLENYEEWLALIDLWNKHDKIKRKGSLDKAKTVYNSNQPGGLSSKNSTGKKPPPGSAKYLGAGGNLGGSSAFLSAHLRALALHGKGSPSWKPDHHKFTEPGKESYTKFH